MSLYDHFASWNENTANATSYSERCTFAAFISMIAVIVGLAIYGEAVGLDPEMAGAEAVNDWHGNVSPSGWETPTVTGIAGSDNRF